VSVAVDDVDMMEDVVDDAVWMLDLLKRAAVVGFRVADATSLEVVRVHSAKEKWEKVISHVIPQLMFSALCTVNVYYEVILHIIAFKPSGNMVRMLIFVTLVSLLFLLFQNHCLARTSTTRCYRFSCFSLCNKIFRRKTVKVQRKFVDQTMWPLCSDSAC